MVEYFPGIPVPSVDAVRGHVVLRHPVPRDSWAITCRRLDALDTPAGSSTRPAIVGRDEADGIILEDHTGGDGFHSPEAERAVAVWLPVLEELSAAHALGIVHGDLSSALATVDGFIVVRGLGLPREHREDDEVVLGGLLGRAAPSARPEISDDVARLGRRLGQRDISLADAAAALRDAHARVVAASGLDALLEGAIHVAHPDKTLDRIDALGLLSSSTIPAVSRALGPALVGALHAGSSRRHVRLLARLSLTDLLIERADDGAASIGARIAAIRVLEHSAAPPVDDLVRLLNDPVPVVVTAARRALLRARSPVIVSRRGAAWTRCPHPWSDAMGDQNAARTRLCPSCDARVASVLEMGDLVEERTPLVILDGPEGRHRFAMIGDEVTIGRSHECDIAIGLALIPPLLLTVRTHDAGTFVIAEEPVTIEQNGQQVQATRSPALTGNDAVHFHGLTMRFGFAENTRLAETVLLPMGRRRRIEPYGPVLLLGPSFDVDDVYGRHVLEAIVEQATRGTLVWSVDAPLSHGGLDGLDFVHLVEGTPGLVGVGSWELRRAIGHLELVATPEPVADALEPDAEDLDTIEDGPPFDG